MPYTAKLVSKQAKLPYSKSRLTTDPEYNINFSHYIAGLILQYDGISFCYSCIQCWTILEKNK